MQARSARDRREQKTPRAFKAGVGTFSSPASSKGIVPPPPDAFGVCPPPPSWGEGEGGQGGEGEGHICSFTPAPLLPLDICVADVV